MGQVVLITGGTSGIGLSLAEAFLAEGASVAVCGRSQTALDRFSRAHPEALAVQADVTVPEARATLLDAITERFGRLDVLINNAGTFVARDFAGDAATVALDALDALDQEIDLNLTAPIHLTGEALRRWPALSAIVFVTSGFPLVSPTLAPTYGASRRAAKASPTGCAASSALPQHIHPDLRPARHPRARGHRVLREQRDRLDPEVAHRHV